MTSAVARDRRHPAPARPRRLIVVGTGVVGRRIERRLARSVDATDRPNWTTSNVARLDAAEVATAGVGPGDVVVMAGAVPHAPAAARLADHGASVISVGDALDDSRALLDLDDAFCDGGGTLVVGAAMAPGLSGLLAALLIGRVERADEVHIAFHATAGPACARQHHRALRGWALGWHDGAWIERPAGSGRELCWFPEPVGAHDCYRAELPDPLLLQRTHPDVARISARVSATRRDRLTARLPMLRPPHAEGGVGALRVEVRGVGHDGSREVLVAGVAEMVGTTAAATATVFARSVMRGELPAGVVVTADPTLPTVDLLAAIGSHGVRFQEFTGVPQSP